MCSALTVCASTKGPNYMASQGAIYCHQERQAGTQLCPQKRHYNASGMPMTEASIDTGIPADLYVSLGEPIPELQRRLVGARLIKPFVDWIWVGCLLMAFGGVLAISDRRYRIHARKKADRTSEAGLR